MENKIYLKNLIKKVINEGIKTEVSENLLRNAIKQIGSFKELSPELKTAFEDVYKAGVKNGDLINIYVKDAKTGKMVTRPVKNADELFKALKEGGQTLKGGQNARLYSGILKSPIKLDATTLSKVTEDLVKSARFKNEYGALPLKDIEKMLKTKGYNPASQKEILKQVEAGRAAGKFPAVGGSAKGVEAGKTAQVGKAEAGGAKTTATAKSGDVVLNVKIENTVAPLKNEKVAIDAAEGAAAQKEAIDGAKAAGDTKATEVLEKARTRSRKRKPKARTKLLDRIKKMKATQRILYGLAVITGGYLAYRFLFGPNTNPEIPENNVLPDCVQAIMDDDGVTVDTVDGVVIVKVTETGVEEYDRAGGLIFKNDYTVEMADGSRTGTYKCKEVGGESSIETEPTGGETEPAGETAESLQEIKIRFSQILNYTKNLITEQDVTLQQMTSYVDTAVDDLDGWVDNGNLQSLKNILTSLKGKTYKGKNAIGEFLRFYSADESGDDFIADVSSVGVTTLGVQGIELKDEIIQLAQSGQVSTGKDFEGDGDKKTGIGGIEITWNQREVPTPIVTRPIEQEWKDCFDFPIGPGCVARQIVFIQNCYYKKGIYKGNIDGKFTKEFNALLEYIHKSLGIKTPYENKLTKELYVAIQPNCEAGPAPVTVTPTAQVSPIDVPPVTPLPEPVYDKNRLNELLASRYLVKKRNGKIVKWKGPELTGEDWFILNKYLTDQGYNQKKGREIGDKDDDDVQMKYKWKLNTEE